MVDYYLTDIGVPPEGIASRAWAVNAAGDLVFDWWRSGNQGYVSAAYRSHDTTVVELDQPGHYDVVTAINVAGEAVGYHTPAMGPRTPFVWATGQFWPLTGPWFHALAWGVNDRGQAVGEGGGTWDPDQNGVLEPTSKPVTWNVNNAGSELPTSTGSGKALGVNNDGTIVGLVTLPSNRGTLPVTWGTDSVERRLPILNGVGRAVAINDAEQIVGTVTVGGNDRATLWKGGSPTDLGTLGGPSSVATAISADGTVVGYSTVDNSGTSRAFVWRDGTMQDLLSTVTHGADGWQLLEATGIGDHGHIVGYGVHNGSTRGFVISPVAPHQPTLADRLRSIVDAQLTYILYGVLLGQGGVVFQPGQRPHPVPPENPYRPSQINQLIGPDVRRAVAAIVADQLAGNLDEAASREALRMAADQLRRDNPALAELARPIAHGAERELRPRR
jgi:probable HAF family extracellular repeat protein